MAPAVEIDQGLQRDGGLDVGWGGRGRERGGLGGEVVVAVDVGGVVFGVVEFHDLPGDGGFEGGVGVWCEGGGWFVGFEMGGKGRGRAYRGGRGRWLWCG